ncbi:hypothetical protein HK097_002822, partial [Rhizophlyctis rosea]
MSRNRGDLGRVPDQILRTVLKSDCFNKALSSAQAKKIFGTDENQSFTEYVASTGSEDVWVELSGRIVYIVKLQNEERDNSIISQSFKSTCLKILSALYAGVRFGYLSEPVPFYTEKTDTNTDKPEWKDDVDVEDLLDALDTSLSVTENACLVNANMSGDVYGDNEDVVDRWQMAATSTFSFPPEQPESAKDPNVRKVLCVVSMLEPTTKKKKASGVKATDEGAEPAQIRRSIKILAHYIGKELLSLQPCTLEKNCVMAAVQGEEFLGPLHFCAVCFQKLHHRLNWDVKARSEGLKEVLSSLPGFEEEVQWLSKLIYTIETAEEAKAIPRKRKSVTNGEDLGGSQGAPKSAKRV